MYKSKISRLKTKLKKKEKELDEIALYSEEKDKDKIKKLLEETAEIDLQIQLYQNLNNEGEN